jgi:hypothetical protein
MDTTNKPEQAKTQTVLKQHKKDDDEEKTRKYQQMTKHNKNKTKRRRTYPFLICSYWKLWWIFIKPFIIIDIINNHCGINITNSRQQSTC